MQNVSIDVMQKPASRSLVETLADFTCRNSATFVTETLMQNLKRSLYIIWQKELRTNIQQLYTQRLRRILQTFTIMSRAISTNESADICRTSNQESLEQIHNHVCRIVHDFERSLHEIVAEMYAMPNYSRSLRNNMHAESWPTCQQNCQCNISPSIFAVCTLQDYSVRNVCLFAILGREYPRNLVYNI